MRSDFHILINVCRIAMDMGQVERLTQHADGRAESVATHTLMMLQAWDYIATETHAPAQLCWDVTRLILWHDAHEARGPLKDVPTLNPLTPEQWKAKEDSDHIGQRIVEAETRMLARAPKRDQKWQGAFILWALDKLMPNIVVCINGGMAASQITDWNAWETRNNENMKRCRNESMWYGPAAQEIARQFCMISTVAANILKEAKT